MKLHISGILAAFCLAGAEVFGAAPLLADETPAFVIDPEAPVTLTIHKYENNDAYQTVGNGCVQTVPGTPMEGIEYSVCRIGSWTSAGDSEEVGTYISDLSDDFLKFLNSQETGGETMIDARTVGGVTVYTTDELQSAVSSINAMTGETPGAVLMTDFVREHKSVSGLTGADGTLQFKDLAQGIYLVAETDTSGMAREETDEAARSVMAGSEPFLVALPMTAMSGENGQTAGSAWQYDVHVYPKNATISISKYIVDEDGEKLLRADDREIGQNTVQILTPSVPAVRDSQAYETYIVEDAMDEGLSFVSVDSVKLGSFVDSPEGMSSFSDFTELDSGDYIVGGAPGDSSFLVAFTQTGLEALNSVEADSQLVITFTSRLNGSAPAGTGEMISNTPELTVKTKDTVQSTLRGNTPELCTYALELTKMGLDDASLAAFAVKQDEKEVLFTEESSGVYHVTGESENETGKAEIYPDSAGKLVIKGFDSKEYTFTETATEPGKSLLTEPFRIAFESDSADGSLSRALILKDDQENALNVSNGTAYCTIFNYPTAALNTGGSGFLPFWAAGALLILAAAGLTIHRTKSLHK
ncbi:MAG: SpaH/EbpB family LPXTG-anchored major pilin [Lachnospiraceae bacterium]|jgi:fimbrial isopeptide formation D2 family protein